MSKTKYAVFTMDVESFTDTDCVSALNLDTGVDLLDGFDEYIKILDRHGIKSTMFVVGNLAPKIVDRLKQYIGNGHRLALHSYEHTATVYEEPHTFRERLMRTKKQLTELFHTEIEGFRAPCFSIDRERLDIVKELGFKYDSSQMDFKARHTVKLDLSGFQQVRNGIFRHNDFFEFGMSEQKVFGSPFPVSGGGYVRIGNWPFVKNLIDQFIHKHDYYVFYLHPFELTHEKVPFLRQLKSYDQYYLQCGINTYAAKIEWIIKTLKKCGYEFVTFEELSGIMQRECV